MDFFLGGVIFLGKLFLGRFFNLCYFSVTTCHLPLPIFFPLFHFVWLYPSHIELLSLLVFSWGFLGLTCTTWFFIVQNTFLVIMLRTQLILDTQSSFLSHLFFKYYSHYYSETRFYFCLLLWTLMFAFPSE